MKIRTLATLAILAAGFAAPALAMDPAQCHRDCDDRLDAMTTGGVSNSGNMSDFDTQCHALCDDLGSAQAAFLACMETATLDFEKEDCRKAYMTDRPDFSTLNRDN